MPKGHPTSSDRLAEYRRKRDADQTPEPFGEERSAERRHHGLFVAQLHAARRQHWDLRLELDGVLRSWAVPKGFSLDPDEKRFAAQTEDHPIEYGDFEGVIPEGNYGAGAMIVWDRGLWVALEDPWEGFDKGKLLFELRGFKLRGVWTLFRTKPPAIHRGKRPDEDKNWLLMKKPDGHARRPGEAGFALPEDSVLSGLRVDELAEGVRFSDRAERALRGRKKIEKKELDPFRVELQLATNGDRPFDRKGWLFEIKYDGYRLIAAKTDDGPRLRYRNGHDATALFPEITRTLRHLTLDRVLFDGEVIVSGPDGRPSFNGLQQRALLSRPLDIERASIERPATLMVFDLLEVDGRDVRGLPLRERKEILAQLLPSTGPLRICEHLETIGTAFYAQAQQMGLEGMMAKRADSKYVGGRSDAWLRYRVEHTGDFVLVGFSEPKRGRKGFGALHLGLYDDEGTLHYLGRVGTGFSNELLSDLGEQLRRLVEESEAPSLEGELPSGEGHHWVQPQLVAEVRFKERTGAGMLRHPVFLGLRTDKAPIDCTLASSLPPEADASHEEPPEPSAVAAPPKVQFTNRDKLFWPGDGYTKGDLIDYYRAISPWILPYLRDRPVVLTRYPDGIDGKSFFQKNAPDFAPDWIRTVTIHSEGSQRDIDYFVCNDEDTLLYLANLATIPLHVWSSRLADLEHPDWTIVDLDPKDAPFEHVLRIARALRKLCDGLGLPSYVKTSGSSGLHVLVPLGGQLDYRGSRTLAEILARLVVEQCDDIATVARSLSDREGKVYVDYGQNGWGKLLVAPFCVRPQARAPVSTPLRWSEVRKGLTIEKHNIRSVPKRMQRLREDPMRAVLDGEVPDLGRLLSSER